MVDFHQDINRISLNEGLCQDYNNPNWITNILLWICLSKPKSTTFKKESIKIPSKCKTSLYVMIEIWIPSWYIYILMLHNKCDPRCICSWCYTPSSYSQTTQYKDNTFSWSKFLVFWILFSKTTKQNSLVDIAVRKKELGYISLTMLHKR